MADPLAQLAEAGVSIWLDDLSRTRLRTGTLAALVRDKHVTGVTTNPSIFQKSLADSEAYEAQLHDLRARGVDVGEAVRAITAMDVREACDVLRAVYDATDGADGFVSIEVDPRLSADTERTVAEARALWWLVDRPNLLVKIPATVPGLPAIAQCLAEGINVNVTLIFSRERYAAVLEAFLEGLERFRVGGGDVTRMASVASFFVSRVDTEVDAQLDKLATPEAAALRGQAAIANARLAFEHFESVLESPRWQSLAEAGARPQRPLWASTGVKDPTYLDTRYVVDLAVPGTVNTMPEPTLQAVADHGEVVSDAVRGHYDEARATLAGLTEVGISYSEVVEQLEREGVQKFEDAWAELLTELTKQLAAAK